MMNDRPWKNWSREELYYAAIHVLAMVFVVSSVDMLPWFFVELASENGVQFRSLWISSLNVVVPLLLAFLTVFFAESLSRWLSDQPLGDGTEVEARLRLPAVSGLLNIGIVLIGLLTLIDATGTMVHLTMLKEALTLDPLPDWSDMVSGETKARLSASVVKGLFGLMLLIWNDRVVTWLLPAGEVDSSSVTDSGNDHDSRT
jgi:hypothetical protein